MKRSLFKRGHHAVLVWLRWETPASLVGKEIKMAMDDLQTLANDTLEALGRAKTIVDNANASGTAKDEQIAALEAQVTGAQQEAIGIMQPVHDAAVALAPPPQPEPQPQPTV